MEKSKISILVEDGEDDEIYFKQIEEMNLLGEIKSEESYKTVMAKVATTTGKKKRSHAEMVKEDKPIGPLSELNENTEAKDKVENADEPVLKVSWF